MKEAAFTMTGRAIQIDKRLPLFLGGGIKIMIGWGSESKSLA